MTRRLLQTKVIDKTQEKKQRDSLVHSIAVEETVKTNLKNEINDAEIVLEDLSKLIEEKKEEALSFEAAARQAELSFKDASATLRNVTSEVSSKEASLKKLITDENSILDRINESAKRAQTETSEMVLKFNSTHKEMESVVSRLDSEIKQKNALIGSLALQESSISDNLKRKQEELSLVSQLINSKFTELSNIDISIKTAESELVEATDKLADLEQSLVIKQFEIVSKQDEVDKLGKEVKEKEDEVLSKREQLVSLVTKEQRVNELIPAIVALYEKAGINIKI